VAVSFSGGEGLEYPGKTTNLSQVTDKLDHISVWSSLALHAHCRQDTTTPNCLEHNRGQRQNKHKSKYQYIWPMADAIFHEHLCSPVFTVFTCVHLCSLCSPVFTCVHSRVFFSAMSVLFIILVFCIVLFVFVLYLFPNVACFS